MSRQQGSLVIVVRVWHDDDGIRAVLQASTRPDESAYTSTVELEGAFGAVLDSWQRESGGGSRVQQLRGE